MKAKSRVCNPPAKPLLFFDGGCEFCSFWVERWRRIVGNRAEFVPYQSSEARKQFPEISFKEFVQSVQLIEPDGSVYDGAEAVFRVRATNPKNWMLLWLYEKLPGFASASEWFYRMVASHRQFFSKLNRIFSGTSKPSQAH